MSHEKSLIGSESARLHLIGIQFETHLFIRRRVNITRLVNNRADQQCEIEQTCFFNIQEKELLVENINILARDMDEIYKTNRSSSTRLLYRGTIQNTRTTLSAL